MLKLQLILFLVLGLTLQTCIKGCLKCTTDNKCILCDTTANYKLENDSCTLVDQPNCSHINIAGDCLVCDNGYWMNTTTKKCVVVETEKKVVNCLSYTSSQTCMDCEPHFIIEAAKCKAVTEQLTNCEVYKTLTTCSDCKKGYFVSTDEKSCESVPTVSDCAFLSRFQCDSCASGFILNQNLYFKNSFKTSSTLEKEDTLANVLLNKAGIKMLVNRPVCQAITVTSCAVYETFNLCKTCIPGYFIKEDKTCQAYPKSVILNCATYSSNTTCTLCNQGFYLSSSTECKIVATVENCTEYSQTSNTTQCTKCSAEFYLASATSCSARSISAQSKISNCKSKSSNSDKCEICNTNFVLSSGGDECAASLASCFKHNTFTAGNTPTCSQCVNGFYLDNNVCTAGTDTNCEIFSTGGSCSECKNKFFHISTAVCEAHDANTNCLKYSDTVKNTCVNCENETFNFLIANRCKVLTAIPNCVTYNHLTNATVAKCGLCEAGYYESTDGLSCILIQVANCAKVNNTAPTVCTECSPTYNLFNFAGPTTECRSPHEYFNEQCNNLNNPGTNRIFASSCTDCKTGALTVDYENNFACINDEYLKEDSIGIITPIAGCVKYDGTKCVMCESGKFLQADRLSCLVNCGANTEFSPFKTVNAGGDYYVSLYNVCGAANVTNKISIEDVTDIGSQILISCADAHMPVVATTLTVGTAQSYSNVNLVGSFGNWIQDIGTVNPELASCTPFTGGNKLADDTTALDASCDLYAAEGTASTFGCVRCKHGFSAKANGSGSKVLTPGGCSTMTSCSADKYGNIPAYWAKFFSCHKCSSSSPDNIPYLMYKFATTKTGIAFGSFDQYELTNATSWATGNVNKSIECLDNKTVATFRTQIGAPNGLAVSFVENCGLGIFDLNATRANFDNSKIAGATYDSTTFCAACKPGFMPDVASNPKDPHTVRVCLNIDNCDNSTWFNACSQCNTDYVFDYTGTGVDYTKCVLHANTGCFAAAASSKCSLCKKGFNKNKDGICVVVNTPKCQDNKFVSRITVTKANKPNDVGYLYWFSEQGAGCNQCNSGYSAVLYSSSNYPQLSCAASSYVSTHSTKFPNDPTDSPSAYIDNCSNYKVDASNILCTKCSGNFVLRQDGKECISVLNCVEAVIGNTVGCAVCAVGHGLTTGGGCVAGNTANCATYFTSTANATAKCNTCNEGFYRTTGGLCEEGAVSNCKEQGNTAKKCTTCKDGYFLIQNNLLSGDYDYCYKFESSLNCSAVTITNESNKGARFNCSICSVGNSILESPLDTENQTNCLSFNLIENCDTYNVGDDLNSTSFSCSLCKTGFFSTTDGFKCVKRTVSPAGCKNYKNDADLCSVCNEGNFLSQDKKECTPFPTGVIGCITYSNATTCTACGNETWLNEGACTTVVADALVTNCLAYSNATTCSNCQPNFILEGNACVALNVSNCDTYASKDACESCLLGFRLKTENGKTNCESFTKPNCKVFDQSGTNPCLECNQNFYINSDGECAAASPLIANCLTNSAIDTCKICSPGFALSKDRKTCVNASEFDNNCGVVSMPQNMSCSQCSPGYYFKDGKCSAFSGMSISAGCFSQDLEDEKVCLVCNTGYYMNSSLNCVKIETTPDNGGEVPDDSSFGILRSLIVLIVGFLFLN